MKSNHLRIILTALSLWKIALSDPPYYGNLRNHEGLKFEINPRDLILNPKAAAASSLLVKDPHYFIGMWVKPLSGEQKDWGNRNRKAKNQQSSYIIKNMEGKNCNYLDFKSFEPKWIYLAFVYKAFPSDPNLLRKFEILRSPIINLGSLATDKGVCKTLFSALGMKEEYRLNQGAAERTIDFTHLDPSTAAGSPGVASAKFSNIISGLTTVSKDKATIKPRLVLITGRAFDIPVEFFFTRFNFSPTNPTRSLKEAIRDESNQELSADELYSRFSPYGIELKHKDTIDLGMIELFPPDTAPRRTVTLSLNFLLISPRKNLHNNLFYLKTKLTHSAQGQSEGEKDFKLVYTYQMKFNNRESFGLETKGDLYVDGEVKSTNTYSSKINIGTLREDLVDMNMNVIFYYTETGKRMSYYPYVRIRSQKNLYTRPQVNEGIELNNYFEDFPNLTENNGRVGLVLEYGTIHSEDLALSLTHAKIYKGGYIADTSHSLYGSFNGQNIANCLDQLNSDQYAICLKCYRGFYWDHQVKACLKCSEALPGCLECSKSHTEDRPVCNSCGQSERDPRNIAIEGCNRKRCQGKKEDYDSCGWCSSIPIDKGGCKCQDQNVQEDCGGDLQPNCKFKCDLYPWNKSFRSLLFSNSRIGYAQYFGDLCGACKGVFLLDENSNCVDPDSTAYFASLVNGRYGVKACVTDCLTCESQTSCMACKNGKTSLKDRAGNTKCLNQNQINDAHGPDPEDITNSKRKKLCPKGCDSCSQNADICEVCHGGSDDVILRKRFPDGTHEDSCVSKANIPDDFGRNVKALTNNIEVWEQCMTTGCVNCKHDHRDCQLCKQIDSGEPSTPYVYLKTNNQASPGNPITTCVEGIEEGYGESGINLITKQKKIKPCTVDGCSDCKASYDVCSQCKEPLVKEEEDLNGNKVVKCIEKQKNEAKNCNIKGCLTCKIGNDRANECTACDNKNNYFAEKIGVTVKQCTHKNQIEPGKGIDLVGKLIKSCQDPRCHDCREDVKTCSGCIEGRFLDEKTRRCSLCVEDGKWIDKSLCRDCLPTCKQRFNLF